MHDDAGASPPVGLVAEDGDQRVAAPLRLGFVPGATPDKWAARFRSRFGDESLELVEILPNQVIPALADASLDAALAPLPVNRDVFHAIPLYEEGAVIVVPKKHDLTIFNEAPTPIADLELADENVFVPQDAGWSSDFADDGGPATTPEAIDWVAAEAGLAVLPMPLARRYQRKDVTSIVLADVAGRQIGLVWRKDADHPRLEDLAGIVRGRTANSSRGQTATQAAPAPSKSAKTAAPKAGTAKTKTGKSGAKQIRKTSNRRPRRRTS